MDAMLPRSESPASRNVFAEAAYRRRALFQARDALSAVILSEAETISTVSVPDQATPAPAPRPPIVLTLKKPTPPTSWRAKRAAAAQARKRRAALLATGLFDGGWYNTRYPDVRAASVDPLTHFLSDGSYEGRSPGPAFDAMAYLARYPDVLEARIEPWLHYAQHGRAEGRVAV